jgi:hypothetical protein
MTGARGQVKEGRLGRRKGRKVEYKEWETAERRGGTRYYIHYRTPSKSQRKCTASIFRVEPLFTASFLLVACLLPLKQFRISTALHGTPSHHLPE